MPKGKRIIKYTPFGSDKTFRFEVPESASEDDIHSIASDIILKDTSLLNSSKKEEQPSRPVEKPSVPEELADAAIGLGGGALNALGTGFNVIDRANPLGAPLRAGLKSMIEGGEFLGPASKESMFTNFGDTLEPATTGKEVVQALQNKMGVRDVSLSDIVPQAFSETGVGLPFKKGGVGDITLSGALGTGMEMLTDPFSGAIGKRVAGPVTSRVAKTFKGLPEAVGSTLTGIERRPIRTYMNRPGPIFNPEIGKSERVGNYLREKFPKMFGGQDPLAELERVYGKDESAVARAVSDAKEEMHETLLRARRFLSKKVTRAIEKNNLSNVPLYNDDVISVLKKHLADLPDTFDADKHQIQAMIDDIERVSKPNTINAYKANGPLPYPGQTGGILTPNVSLQQQVVNGPEISLKELNAQKQKLQDIAEDVYVKNGVVFNHGKRAQIAARDAAAVARRKIENFLDNLPTPDDSLKNSNKLLGELHDFMDRKGIKNLLNKDSAPGDLLAAGAAANGNTLKNIEDLDSFFRDRLNMTPRRRPLDSTRKGFGLHGFEKDAAGNPVNVTNDFKGTAENLAAFNRFSNPGFLPIDTTGKAVARQNLASHVAKAGASAALGSMGGPVGAAAGVALNSPIGLRGALNTYRAIKRSGPLGNAILRGSSIGDRTKKHQIWQQKLMSKIVNTPYQEQFAEAQQKGEQSFNAQFFKSYLSDPEFQKLYKSDGYATNDDENEMSDDELELFADQ